MAKKISTDHKGLGIVLTHSLLAIVAIGVLILLGMIITKGGDGWDVAAFLLVLQSVIGVVRTIQSQTSIDKSVDRLAESQPLALPAPEAFDPKALDQFENYNSFGGEPPSPTEAADAVAEAASDKRDEIKGKVET